METDDILKRALDWLRAGENSLYFTTSDLIADLWDALKTSTNTEMVLKVENQAVLTANTLLLDANSKLRNENEQMRKVFSNAGLTWDVGYIERLVDIERDTNRRNNDILALAESARLALEEIEAHARGNT